MKKFYALLFICFNVIMLSAQVEIVSQNEFLSRAEHIDFDANTHHWLVAGSEAVDPIGSWSIGYSYLAKLDSLGNTIWKTNNIGSAEVVYTQKMAVLDNSHIAMIYNSGLCDVVGSDTLSIFNENGVKLTSTHRFQESRDLIGIQGNEFIIAYRAYPNMVIERLNSTNLSTIWTDTIPNYHGTVQLKMSSNNTVFVFTESEIIKLNGQTGHSISNYGSGSTFQGIAQDYVNDAFYLIDSSRNVIWMDTAFNIGFASFSIASDFDKVTKAMMSAPNQITVLGQKGTKSGIKIYDSGFSPIHSTTLSAYQSIHDFALSDDRIAAVGVDISDTINYNPSFLLQQNSDVSMHSLFKTYSPTLQSTNNNIDVGITNFQFDAFTSSFSTCSTNSVFDYTFQNASVIIKNYGTTTLNDVSIYLRKPIGCLSVCTSTIMLKHSFSNLNLQAGDSTVLSLNDVNVPYQYNNHSGNYYLCFWTGAPNAQLDANNSNNKYCIPIQMVNTKDIIQAEQLKIFPNPVIETLQIDLPNTNKNGQFQVINMAGQLILTEKISNKKHQAIDVSKLSSGFYILKYQDEEGIIYTNKFVKQ